MGVDDILYFIADRNSYREGKINILSAKSSVLKSRERIKKILQLREMEHEYRKKIVKSVGIIRNNIKEFATKLPKTRLKVPSRVPTPQVKTINPVELQKTKRTIYKDEISQELATIEEKLKELQC